MGLDWKPLNKPKKGMENEFKNLFEILDGRKKTKLSFFDKILGKKSYNETEVQNRFFEISTTPYETLNAPRVGFDTKATEWAKQNFENRTDKAQNYEEFMKEMYGYWVVDLVELQDGIPTYIALHDEAHVFRGKFLDDCEKIMGPELYNEAYSSKLAEEAIDYGNRILSLANTYAKENNLEHLRNVRNPPDADEFSPESLVHILYSSAKWVKWWGERGHGYEAYF